MTNISGNSTKGLHRLWSIPLFLGGVYWLVQGLSGGPLNYLLLGVGALLGAVFAFRHNLLDLTPHGLDPARIGKSGIAILSASVLFVLSAAVVAVTS